MSLFNAINTAISGLSAQSASFGNISEDVANSQTTGFKRIDTSFINYLTTSTSTENQPGAVVAKPDYINDVQGSITQTDNDGSAKPILGASVVQYLTYISNEARFLSTGNGPLHWIVGAYQFSGQGEFSPLISVTNGVDHRVWQL